MTEIIFIFLFFSFFIFIVPLKMKVSILPQVLHASNESNASFQRLPFLSGPITPIFGFFHFRVFPKYFWLGGAAPQIPQFLAGGAKPPQTPPKRSFATFDRGGQTGPPRSNVCFFGAVDDPQNDRRMPPHGRRTSCDVRPPPPMVKMCTDYFAERFH